MVFTNKQYMNNYSKNMIAIAIALLTLMAFKSMSNMDEIELSDTEYLESDNTDFTYVMAIDTIPDPNPEEQEEEPEVEPDIPEEEPEIPEEDADPIPDTIGIWRIK